jgi:phosphatidylserine decarboxylase
MAEKLEDWLNGEVAELSKMSVGELSNNFFFRDPIRPTFIDYEHFYSPSDGTILYQKIVQPGEQVLEIKGIDYTIQDVMGDSEFNKPSLVIGIFMSFYDVHINRIPYGGILKYKRLEPIESTNKPMLAVEKDILNKVINPNNMAYLKYNERMSNQVYVPSLDYTYHLIQIADEDVNVIAPFKQQGDLCAQNERFSLIRWGSQVDLVLPLDSRYEFETMLDDTMHVNAGLDKLIKINHTQKCLQNPIQTKFTENKE